MDVLSLLLGVNVTDDSEWRSMITNCPQIPSAPENDTVIYSACAQEME